MATGVESKLLTAEEFMAADLGEGAFELVRGEVIEVPLAMPDHGVVCANVVAILWNYGRASGYGYPLSNDSAVVTERDPDTVRGPDVCFYSHARWPQSEVGHGLPPVPPDVVVEVLSPGNRPRDVHTKIVEYQEAGVALVIVVDPFRRRVALYRPGDLLPTVLEETEFLENLPELPGFRCLVADFFIPVSKQGDSGTDRLPQN